MQRIEPGRLPKALFKNIPRRQRDCGSRTWWWWIDQGLLSRFHKNRLKQLNIMVLMMIARAWRTGIWELHNEALKCLTQLCLYLGHSNIHRKEDGIIVLTKTDIYLIFCCPSYFLFIFQLEASSASLIEIYGLLH